MPARLMTKTAARLTISRAVNPLSQTYHSAQKLMNQEANTPTPDNGKSSASPGEMLRQARESLNLTISDLAGQTRLSRGVLEALEKNDFASLAMPVYVRGYFRKCAHVLNIPEDQLLQAYADRTGTPLGAQPLPVTVSTPPREYETTKHGPSWQYVLIIAVVAGAVLWWFASGDGRPAKAKDETTVGVTTLDINPPAYEAQPLTLPPAEGSVTQLEPAPPVNADATAPAVVAVAPATPGTPAPGTTSATVMAPNPLPAQPPAPAGPNTLSLNVTATSWVEIYDETRKRLVYGLLSPGSKQQVTGTPPYQVVLGHPQGVRLTFGGKPVDLTAYTDDNGTARFEVDRN